MYIKFYITIIIALLNVFLGLFILRKNYKNPGNIYYCGLCVSGGLWAFVMAIFLNVTSQQAMDNIIKFTYIFATLPPLFYLLFAYYYPYRLWVFSKFLTSVIFIIPSIFIILLATGLLNLENSTYVSGIVMQKVNFLDFFIFAVYFFSYILWGLIILLKKLKSDIGIYYVNVKYLIFGTVTVFILTGIVSIIIPLFDSFAYDWLGPIFTLLNFAVVGYLLFYKLNKN